MFAVAPQVIKGLLDQAVFHFRIGPQLPGEKLVAETQRTGGLAIKQTGGQA